MKLKQAVLMALALANLVFFSSCATSPVANPTVGAGSAIFANGLFRINEGVPVAKAFAATQAGLKSLDLLPEVNELDDVSGHIEATAAGDKNITVKMHTVGKDITEINIRVGIFGNEAYSRKIYEAIKAHL